MQCARCGVENLEGMNFCEECGAQLVRSCPSCAQEVKSTAKFCGKCGAPLSNQNQPPVSSSEFQVPSSSQPPALQTPNPELRTLQSPTASTQPLAAERRQLTVMFCDLVGSTALSAQLDPEDYRAVVQRYQQTCAEVIQRHEGYLAQYLGDGLLVYFGYPTAHEDDARRAVRTGLEIIDALRHQVPSPVQGEGQGEVRLQVRIGIHSGLVVIGEIGSSEKRELLALGETPNVAARVQGLAEPNTVIISAATHRLLDEQFEGQPFGSYLVKGIDTPIAVYHVQSERQETSPLSRRGTLTPLVGREQEVGLLIDRWEQAKEGRGQVVLLSGEPGIGKSRLAHTLREQVTSEGSLLFEARCSPYHQHSALYPLIEVLQRTLLLTRQDTDCEKIEKLERSLTLYDMQESLPLFTALLSLSTPSTYPPLTLTPQKQKERTLQALLQLLVAQAERQATVSVWEDLHWADPSSLEFLSLLIEQIPTTKLLLVLTFRPEFTSPWKLRSHISQLTLNRLGKKQVEAMIERAATGNKLSAEVIEQIRLKTDGVPLFVEELTKSVIESVASRESRESPRSAPLQLAIPATLQEALLARLDRLSSARQIAQLGATLGREFSYELLHAVASVSEVDLQTALAKLVEAEILYRRGIGEQARYFFKHALIQDTAYQSLLKSTRQQYHQQIARILEERFPDTKEAQPELLAHHYTEANLIEQAIPYWRKAGEKATQRCAYMEAVGHLTQGLELLKTRPDSPQRTHRELTLQIALGRVLMVTKGTGAPEVAEVYAQALALSQQIEDLTLRFQALWGLNNFYTTRGELQKADELTEQLLALAHRMQDSTYLLEAHYMRGLPLWWLGKFAPALEQAEQGLALYATQPSSSRSFLYGRDPGVYHTALAANVLWQLGYPAQAQQRMHEALTLAQELSQPFILAYALNVSCVIASLRREGEAVQEWAETAITLSTDHRFTFFLPWGVILQGWALAERGQGEERIAQMHQGLAAYQTTGAELWQPYFLVLLADACGKIGRKEEGLTTVAEALSMVNKNDERWCEAELYRLRGELTLAQSGVRGPASENPSPQPLAPNTHAEAEAEAEACFLKAIEIAQKQQAKSLELRAATSLARLWQQQALGQSAKSEEVSARNTELGAGSTQHEARTKLAEAHQMLSEVYNWFTEGFDTKDLQEARALIEELSH